MLIAITKAQEKALPRKNVTAFCPVCSMPVIAKMGKVRAHHWAHKEASDCEHGRGMTEWHYRWIMRHHDKNGWEVEFIDKNHRYDCFNKAKNLVLEIQKSANYDYMINKTKAVLARGLCIKWILHLDMFSSMQRTTESFKASTRKRLVCLDVLEYFATCGGVEFYVDSHTLSSHGKSSRGLLRLKPTPRCYNTINFGSYYSVHYVTQDVKQPAL